MRREGRSLAAVADGCKALRARRLGACGDRLPSSARRSLLPSAAVRGRITSFAAVATAFLAAVLAAALPSASSAGAAPAQARAAELRTKSATLELRARSAVVQLYALESALAEARAARERAEAHVEAVERERKRVAGRQLFARRSLAIAQRRLAGRLRTLYEEGSVEPLEILLGADSIGDAIQGLDGIGFAVEQDEAIVALTARAKRELAHAARRLAGRRAAGERARAAAIARTAELERTLAARRAYVERLTRERRLRAARIAALERQAEAATARSKVLVRAPTAPVHAPAPAPASAPEPAEPVSTAPAPAPSAPAVAVTGRARTLTVSASAYALPGRTATGLPVGWGVVAVDPAVIPLGTRMTIPGYGDGVAADVGPAIRGAAIDLWFPSVAAARAWGRRTVTITLH